MWLCSVCKKGGLDPSLDSLDDYANEIEEWVTDLTGIPDFKQALLARLVVTRSPKVYKRTAIHMDENTGVCTLQRLPFTYLSQKITKPIPQTTTTLPASATTSTSTSTSDAIASALAPRQPFVTPQRKPTLQPLKRRVPPPSASESSSEDDDDDENEHKVVTQLLATNTDTTKKRKIIDDVLDVLKVEKRQEESPTY